MSYGLVICGECSREIHQNKDGWHHCDDKTPRCEGATGVYPASPSDIVGEYCGSDDLDCTIVPQKQRFLRERKRNRPPVLGTMLGALGCGAMPWMTQIRMPKIPTFRNEVVLGAKIRDCPSGHHAWYESNVGPVRKPLSAV